ncbi:MAG TPA: nucleotidyltransferase family protein [Pyrinomonadaceae bacterium]|nr:nucleotidyltransferase family protein [Pyrinomonadaceae bacterium]
MGQFSSQTRVGVVVLAAGASTRMGIAATPKQLLVYDGQTLIRRAAETALGSVCHPVVVVLGANAVRVGAELELPVIVTRNREWETGMGSSIRTGLEAVLAADDDVDAIVVQLCDQPFVTAELIDTLIERRRETGKTIIGTEYRGTRGVPALFARELFAELRALSGHEGARQIIRNHPDDTAVVPFVGAAIDIDTPQDYEALCVANE